MTRFLNSFETTLSDEKDNVKRGYGRKSARRSAAHRFFFLV